MKKVFLLLALSLTIVGCSNGGTTTDQGTAPIESSSTQSTNESSTPVEEGTLGNFKVEFGEAKKVTSTYIEGDLLEVTYTFTNNSEDTVSADGVLMVKAYQDGIEIDTEFDTALTGDNESKSIKPGASLECKRLFKLTSNSDVEVEATEFLGLTNDIVSKTFKLQ